MPLELRLMPSIYWNQNKDRYEGYRGQPDLMKYNDTTDTAIDQIHRRNYPKKVAEYTGDILLVAVSYDRKTKEHQCAIERWSAGENRPC